jgi:cytoskeletal protein RodZ
MFELSPELKVLMRASRSASLPTEADSARIFEGLCARLGNAVMGADTLQPAVTSTSSGFSLGKVSVMSLAGVALLGGLWFIAARAQRAVPLETNAAASAAATISAAVVAIPSAAPSSERASVAREGSEVETVAKDGSNRPEAHPAASHHAPDTLAQEVALLSRAETAIHRGKPDVALKALSEHERKFGNGLLKEERIAARVQALCALGRNAEADAQLAQLSSKSLHETQSRKACGWRKND